jgi:hypothetical protein
VADAEGEQMGNLVLLSGERAKKEMEEKQRLIVGLKELLARAECGELKAICYASVDADGQNVTLGILQDDKTGLHELIGLSQMLSDAILQSARD